MKKVLYIAYESLPFIKTGGLADVIYALAKALKRYNADILLPLHKPIKDKYNDKLHLVKTIDIEFLSSSKEARLYQLENEGINYYFIEDDQYFNREDVYGYDDDILRFIFFSKASIQFLIALNQYPSIIHLNDYHTALIPAICKYHYKDHQKIQKLKFIYTIHNLSYQGHFDKHYFDYLGIDKKYWKDGTLRFNNELNLMKIGICSADKITTVSKTYASELLNGIQSEGLYEVLQYYKDNIIGITNGIDDDMFSPLKDKYLYKNYNINSYLKGKALNKKALLKDLGLDDNGDLLVGIVSRLTYQKGFDLFIKVYKQILGRRVKLIVLGSGETKYEYAFRIMEKEYPDNVRYYSIYNEELAHKIYAASDLMLMPSLFEPCGLSQLIAMRYGALPLVRETGGLLETVKPYDEYKKTGRGFSFGPYNAIDFMIVFNYAYRQYFDNQKDFRMLIRNAMSYDSSIKKTALKYEKLYDEVIGKKNVKKI